MRFLLVIIFLGLGGNVFQGVYSAEALDAKAEYSQNNSENGSQSEIFFSAQEAYETAEVFVEEKKYLEAEEILKKIEEEDPFSVWSPKAKILLAEIAYERGETDEVILITDRFIHLYLGHPLLHLAYYLRGAAYFKDITVIGRDQSALMLCLGAFQEFIARYPDSELVPKAQENIQFIRVALAGSDIAIARYYLVNLQYLSALRRFQSVYTQYGDTLYCAEAYYRSVEIFTILGIQDFALDLLHQLEERYPQDEWTLLARELYDRHWAKEGIEKDVEGSLA